MGFKLGRKAKPVTEREMSFKNTPIVRKDLDDGVIAETGREGVIYVDKSVPVDSDLYNTAVKEEMQHITDMKIGKTTHDDKFIYHDGQAWAMLDDYCIDPNTGRKIKLGSRELPWEKNKQ